MPLRCEDTILFPLLLLSLLCLVEGGTVFVYTVSFDNFNMGDDGEVNIVAKWYAQSGGATPQDITQSCKEGGYSFSLDLMQVKTLKCTIADSALVEGKTVYSEVTYNKKGESTERTVRFNPKVVETSEGGSNIFERFLDALRGLFSGEKTCKSNAGVCESGYKCIFTDTAYSGITSEMVASALSKGSNKASIRALLGEAVSQNLAEMAEMGCIPEELGPEYFKPSFQYVQTSTGSKAGVTIGRGVEEGIGGVTAIIRNIDRDTEALGLIEWSFKRQGEPDSSYQALEGCLGGQRVFRNFAWHYDPVSVGAGLSSTFSCSWEKDTRFPDPREGRWVIRVSFLGRSAEIEWHEGIYSDKTMVVDIESCSSRGGVCSEFVCPQGYAPLRMESSCCGGSEKPVDGFECQMPFFMNPCCVQIGTSGIDAEDLYALYLEVNPSLQSTESGTCETDEDCMSFGGECRVGRCDLGVEDEAGNIIYEHGEKTCYTENLQLCAEDCRTYLPLYKACNANTECKSGNEDKDVCETCLNGLYKRDEKNEMDRCCRGSAYWCNAGNGACVYGTWYDDHCVDGVKNCDEEDIDCGGSDCASCDSQEDVPEDGEGTIEVELYEEIRMEDGSRFLEPLIFAPDELGLVPGESACGPDEPVCGYAKIASEVSRILSAYETKPVKKELFGTNGKISVEAVPVGASHLAELLEGDNNILDSVYWKLASPETVSLVVNEDGETEKASFALRWVEIFAECDSNPGEPLLQATWGEHKKWNCALKDKVSLRPFPAKMVDLPTVTFNDQRKVCELTVNILGPGRFEAIYDPEKESELCRDISASPPTGAFLKFVEAGFSGSSSHEGGSATVGRRSSGFSIRTEGLSPSSGSGSGKYRDKSWVVSDCSSDCKSGGSCEWHRDTGQTKFQYFGDLSQFCGLEEVAMICAGQSFVDWGTPLGENTGEDFSEIDEDGCKITFKYLGSDRNVWEKACKCPTLEEQPELVGETCEYISNEQGHAIGVRADGEDVMFSCDGNDRIIKICMLSEGEWGAYDWKVDCGSEKRGVCREMETEVDGDYVDVGYCLSDCLECGLGANGLFDVRCTENECRDIGNHCEYTSEGFFSIFGHGTCAWK
ncbi:MAG: hypothetical protein ACP5E4_00115 [Candidatus Aenigmatarchaeota archaeon]